MAASLQLEHDGKSNVLRIRRELTSTVDSVVVDLSNTQPPNQDNVDKDQASRNIVNRVAQSTDFVCSHSNCGYHHVSETKYILHARSHFVFEATTDALYNTVLKFANGKYLCSACPRSTTDWISFREHIRHHILAKPYTCDLCMVDFASIPGLRIHFQSRHVGRAANFLFNGGVYELNTLLRMLWPESPAVREPLNIRVKAPTHMKTRVSSPTNSGKTLSVDELRQFLADTCQEARMRKSSTESDVGAVGSLVVRHLPGKYELSHGMYRCRTCCYRTNNQVAFSSHVWKHVHGASWKNTCNHNGDGIDSARCAIVHGLIEVLQRMQVTRVVDGLKKTTACEMEANGRGEVAAVGNVASVDNGNYWLYVFVLTFIWPRLRCDVGLEAWVE